MIDIEWSEEEQEFWISCRAFESFGLTRLEAEELHKKLGVALREADEEREIPDQDIDPWTHNMESAFRSCFD